MPYMHTIVTRCSASIEEEWQVFLMPIQDSLEAATTPYEVSPHKGIRISVDDALEAKQLPNYYALRFECITSRLWSII